MSNLADLAFLDAIAQAKLVRTKEVKPIELVEAAIERIEALNPDSFYYPSKTSLNLCDSSFILNGF